MLLITQKAEKSLELMPAVARVTAGSTEFAEPNFVAFASKPEKSTPRSVEGNVTEIVFGRGPRGAFFSCFSFFSAPLRTGVYFAVGLPVAGVRKERPCWRIKRKKRTKSGLLIRCVHQFASQIRAGRPPVRRCRFRTLPVRSRKSRAA
jgi:hypothetical protein